MERDRQQRLWSWFSVFIVYLHQILDFFVFFLILGSHCKLYCFASILCSFLTFSHHLSNFSSSSDPVHHGGRHGSTRMAAFRRSTDPNELKKQTQKTPTKTHAKYYRVHNPKKRPHFHDENRLPTPSAHGPEIGKFRREV